VIGTALRSHSNDAAHRWNLGLLRPLPHPTAQQRILWAVGWAHRDGHAPGMTWTARGAVHLMRGWYRAFGIAEPNNALIFVVKSR